MNYSLPVSTLRRFIHEAIYVEDDQTASAEVLEADKALDALCEILDDRQRVIDRLQQQANTLARFRLLALTILKQAEEERTEAIDYP